MMGAVIMKMTMRSIMTSISETTLISPLSGMRDRDLERRITGPASGVEVSRCRGVGGARCDLDPRTPRPLDPSPSNPPLTHHHRNDLGPESLELALEPVELAREDVVPEHRWNGHGQRQRRRDQRFRDTGRHRADVTRALG